ncbi:MAG: hypothetical protein HLUCCX10_17715 [Algoriphagus marincola HL-49]|uniref:Uncharacterized protein n=1 Tax=Algoriphagus marincola HL-49 TaxID=1305737 RepID=A0A0P7WYT6_9BACT|nr:MAG: hypothetical protein HLUCCX10_17715 [Algoriphagus marincola HL-49]
MEIVKSRPYSRLEIDKMFNQIKAQMHAEALKRGNGKAIYQDCYTGKTLHGGDPYDYEHIFPSEWVHSTYKHLLSDEQIALVVNCPENVGVTLRVINQSKGKHNPEAWFAQAHHIKNNDIDIHLAQSNIRKAKAAIERMAADLAKQNG